MNVVHLVLLLGPVGGDVWSIFCCIFCLKLIMILSGKLLLLAISSMVFHSLSCFALLRGSLNILSM